MSPRRSSRPRLRRPRVRPPEGPRARPHGPAGRGPFRYSIPVRFGDVDHAGVVYFPTILHFFHVAFEEIFPARMGRHYRDVLDAERLGFPTVHLETDFRRPLRFGDVVAVEVRTVRIGDRSITLGFRARRESDGALCAEATIVKACVERPAFVAHALPDWLRDGLARMRDSG